MSAYVSRPAASAILMRRRLRACLRSHAARTRTRGRRRDRYARSGVEDDYRARVESDFRWQLRALRAVPRGDFVNCRNQEFTGYNTMADSGSSDRPASGLMSIPDDLSAAAAAPLLCAGPHDIQRAPQRARKAGDLVAVLGIGDWGHLRPYATPHGIESPPSDDGAEKGELARKVGAHSLYRQFVRDTGQALQKLGGRCSGDRDASGGQGGGATL